MQYKNINKIIIVASTQLWSNIREINMHQNFPQKTR